MACLSLGLTVPSSRPLLAGDGLGPNLISNGTFDDGSVWTLGAGWTISAGRAVRSTDPASGAISQAAAFVAGRTYRVTFTVSSWTSGLVAARFTGGTTRTGTSRTADGTYSEDLLANTGNNSFQLIASGGTGLNVDNVTVREVL